MHNHYLKIPAGDLWGQTLKSSVSLSQIYKVAKGLKDLSNVYFTQTVHINQHQHSTVRDYLLQDNIYPQSNDLNTWKTGMLFEWFKISSTFKDAFTMLM